MFLVTTVTSNTTFENPAATSNVPFQVNRIMMMNLDTAEYIQAGGFFDWKHIGFSRRRIGKDRTDTL